MPFTLALIQSLLVTPIICFAFFTLSFCDGVAPTATTFINCDKTFNCGSITNVTFPFTGGDRPDRCGLPEFRLTCQQPNNVAELTHNSVTYRVLQLDQILKRLTRSRSDLYNNTCPSHFTNSTLNSTFFSFGDQDDDALSIIYGCNSSAMSIKPQNLFSCSIPGVNFTDAYYIVGPIPSDPIRFINCSLSVTVPIQRSAGASLTSREISLSEALMQGFSVNYSDPYENNCSECTRVGGQCGFDSDLGQPVCVCGDRFCALAPLSEDSKNASVALQGGKSGLGTPGGLLTVVAVCVAGIILLGGISYCLLKRCSSWEAVIYWKSDEGNNQQVEAFMRNYGSVAPKLYKYSEIKKMTNSFAKKLGHGGYGSVYRGKLSDGRLVAVKVLNDTNGNGEEFINEVASISRTSHVNVVNLLGFCYDRTKRALIYEFMPNGSLDKFIYQKRSSGDMTKDCQLEWKTLYEIAVGTARGLEYLHKGCNTRIVHFDIKPQNILLDKDFCPKISDFGLARLCKQKQSILSTIGARGTAGYIAPEVFCRNFGGISHKSDVYSYGMMLLEIVGLRRKIGTDSEQTSERYFPNWIYEHLELGKDLEIQGVVNEEEEDTSRKMILVGLWCIQTNPTDRPSMGKVVEMLEGSLEHLKIPPKPFPESPPMARESTQESWTSSI